MGKLSCLGELTLSYNLGDLWQTMICLDQNFEENNGLRTFFWCLSELSRPFRVLFGQTPTSRNITTQLLGSYLKPHDAIPTNTIGSWLTQLLPLSGNDPAILHNIRAASVNTTRQFLPVDVFR